MGALHDSRGRDLLKRPLLGLIDALCALGILPRLILLELVPDLLDELGYSGSVQGVEKGGDRLWFAPVGGRPCGEFHHHRLGCQIEQVEEEGVGINHIDLKLVDAFIGEVAGVERDDGCGIGADCRGENVAIDVAVSSYIPLSSAISAMRSSASRACTERRSR